MKQLREPEWITTWRAIEPIDVPHSTMFSIVRAVRAGLSFDDVQEISGLDLRSFLTTVAAIGSRCTQVGRGTFLVGVVTPSDDGRMSVEHGLDGDIVRSAPGWTRTRRAGDVRKSYAAILCAPEQVLTRALERAATAAAESVTLDYRHYADLYGAATNTLPALHKVVTNPYVVGPYLRAWDSMDGRTVAAIAAAERMLRGCPLDALKENLREAFWLLPNTRMLTLAIQTTQSATTGSARLAGAEKVRSHMRMLRDVDSRYPARLRPRELSNLTQQQFRTLAALDGFRPTGPSSQGDIALTRMTEQGREAMVAASLAVLQPA